MNYNNACIWDETNIAGTDIAQNSRHAIYQDPSTSRWMLETRTGTDYSDTVYRNNFRVNKDSNWLYTQSGWTLFNPIFTREIQIEYIEDTDGVWWITSDDEKIKVTSKVQWWDSSKATAHSIELETILTNWKNKAN